MRTTAIEIPGLASPQARTPAHANAAEPRPEEVMRASAPIGVLIVDDNVDSRYGVWAVLRWRAGIRVRATASAAASTALERRGAEVCLVSSRLGWRRIHRLWQLAAEAKVIVSTVRPTVQLHASAVLAGAVEVIWRYDDPDRLVATIRRVAAGRHRRPDIAPDVIDQVIDRVDDRDRAIVAMLLLGTPPDLVAATLGMSAHALRERRSEIVERL